MLPVAVAGDGDQVSLILEVTVLRGWSGGFVFMVKVRGLAMTFSMG